ncbi:hypothetical protein EGW08_023390 [Elysia chlorotica]|uniref:Fibrinogen C-terminal domain-containing protein n=1 Tax=Elysia chlorotica TaxID=188477 RepID=A0A3S1B0G9_ELYCH|nr:hypothetical protein EGW08_023390 [Elysia chlorotica]
MGLRYVFSTARLVTLLALASLTEGLLQRTERGINGSICETPGVSLSPQRCKKNEQVSFHPPSTPYPVICRSDIQAVDIPLLCDTVTDGGGWIVIQRRSTGEVDFNRDWASYKAGFGSLENDFWLGNEYIQKISCCGYYEIRVEFEFNNRSEFTAYNLFSIDNETLNYTLHIGQPYVGNAGYSLWGSNMAHFSTYDRVNFPVSGEFAQLHRGGWWFYERTPTNESNLNGEWGVPGRLGVFWNSSTQAFSATFTEMKIRKVYLGPDLYYQ